jgi:hypothetical protein
MNDNKMTKIKSKLLREEMKKWKQHCCSGRAGDLFEHYHDISTSLMFGMHKNIVEEYWHAFFREHELPKFKFEDETIEICYISNAKLIFSRVTDKLQERLNEIDAR